MIGASYSLGSRGRLRSFQQRSHFVVQLARDGLSVAAARACFTEGDGDLDVAFAQEIEQVRREGDRAPPVDFISRRSVGERIVKGGGGDRAAERDDRLEEGGLEWQDRIAMRAGAFWKKNERKIAREHSAHLRGDSLDCSPSLPIEKKSAGKPSEQAEDRPRGDFLFGDKNARHRGAEGDDIEIGEMVCDDQSAVRHLAARGDRYVLQA